MLTDHDLQAGLTAAFREQAGPATRVAVDPAGIYPLAVRRHRRRVAVRTASVLGIAALIAGVSVLSSRARPSPSATTGQPPGVLLDAALAAPAPAAIADSGMPPFYVTADHNRPLATVRDSATGKTLSEVPLPAGIDPKLSEITAAGNDRTFALALSSYPQTRFYLMHVAAGGRSARLAALPIPPLPAGAIADAIALSPDGSKLAVSMQHGGGQQGAVEVVSLATGTVRTWTAGSTGLPGDLSWADGGRDLGFFWQDTGPGSSSPRTSRSGLWLLDTTTPGNNLMSGSRVLPAQVGSDTVQSAVLTANGSRIIASVIYNGVDHVSRGTVVGGIAELSAQTGRPLRTLLAQHAAYSADPGHADWGITPCTLVPANATASHLLLSCDSFGRLDHGSFTALPGTAPQTAIAAAW